MKPHYFLKAALEKRQNKEEKDEATLRFHRQRLSLDVDDTSFKRNLQERMQTFTSELEANYSVKPSRLQISQIHCLKVYIFSIRLFFLSNLRLFLFFE